MRRATWLPGGRLKERACDISCPASHRGPTASAIVPQRVRVSLLLLPEATPLLHRSPQPCRPARHPPVLPLSQSRQRAGPPSVHTCCGVCWQPVPRLAAPCRALPRLAAPCRALPRRSQPTPGAARTRQIDPFGCRDDLDIDGNVFNQSAVGEDDGSGIPNLGFLRVVRGATLPQHSTHLHPHLDRSTAPTCPA
jgi:hypothetical protein